MKSIINITFNADCTVYTREFVLVCAQISQLFLASLHRLQTEIKFEPIKEIKINTIVQKDNGRTNELCIIIAM